MSNLSNYLLAQPLLTVSNLTTNASSQDVKNMACRGFLGRFNCTSLNAGAPTGVFALMAKDPGAGNPTYTQLAATAAITLVVGVNLFEFYPGLSGTSPLINVACPDVFQIKLTFGGTGGITGTLSGTLLV